MKQKVFEYNAIFQEENEGVSRTDCNFQLFLLSYFHQLGFLHRIFHNIHGIDIPNGAPFSAIEQQSDKVKDAKYRLLYAIRDNDYNIKFIYISSPDGANKQVLANENPKKYGYDISFDGKYISRSNGKELEIAKASNILNFTPIDKITDNINLLHRIGNAIWSEDDAHIGYVTTNYVGELSSYGLGSPLEHEFYLIRSDGSNKKLMKRFKGSTGGSPVLLGINIKKGESYWEYQCHECYGKFYVESLTDGSKIREITENYNPFWKHPHSLPER